MDIEKDLILLNDEINKNANGHLSLNSRVQLMRKINSNNIINKIYYACVVKVTQMNVDIFENNILNDILLKSKDFLYNNKYSKSYFWEIYDKYKNFLNNFDAIGWILLSLCKNIETDASFIWDMDDYTDDDVYDFEVWTPDFFAEIIFSGGSPFVNNDINTVEKRKKYWLWYIQMVRKIFQNPNVEYLLLPSYEKRGHLISIPFRHQLHLVSANGRISFDDIRNIILLQIPDEIKWNYINVEFVSCTSSMLNVFSSTGEKIKIRHMNVVDICREFRLKRKEMYMQYPKEGAWFSLKMVIEKNYSYKLEFNYDNFNEIPAYFQELDWIFNFYCKFPRSKEYTPEWLRKIIGNKGEYLED